jgi:hypothetical protein
MAYDHHRSRHQNGFLRAVPLSYLDGNAFQCRIDLQGDLPYALRNGHAEAWPHNAPQNGARKSYLGLCGLRFRPANFEQLGHSHQVGQ